jgi:hypothetical protein
MLPVAARGYAVADVSPSGRIQGPIKAAVLVEEVPWWDGLLGAGVVVILALVGLRAFRRH